jgi:hypothetical protein
MKAAVYNRIGSNPQFYKKPECLPRLPCRPETWQSFISIGPHEYPG